MNQFIDSMMSSTPLDKNVCSLQNDYIKFFYVPLDCFILEPPGADFVDLFDLIDKNDLPDLFDLPLACDELPGTKLNFVMEHGTTARELVAIDIHGTVHCNCVDKQLRMFS